MSFKAGDEVLVITDGRRGTVSHVIYSVYFEGEAGSEKFVAEDLMPAPKVKYVDNSGKRFDPELLDPPAPPAFIDELVRMGFLTQVY